MEVISREVHSQNMVAIKSKNTKLGIILEKCYILKVLDFVSTERTFPASQKLFGQNIKLLFL